MSYLGPTPFWTPFWTRPLLDNCHEISAGRSFVIRFFEIKDYFFLDGMWSLGWGRFLPLFEVEGSSLSFFFFFFQNDFLLYFSSVFMRLS